MIEPGVYPDLPEADYIADPVPGGSLSASGVRKLLPPSCPAKFRYWADHPKTPTPDMEFGHVAHKLHLGIGPELVIVEAENWLTKAAKTARNEARAAGKVAVLREDYEEAQAMVAALREHPDAAALFHPDSGLPEQSLFWTDARTGVQRRSRLDWLPHHRAGRMVIPDYKTTRSAAKDALQRSMYDYDYHVQGAWYIEAVLALGLAEEAAFVLVAQEKEPPYLVNVVEPDPTALRVARERIRQALEMFRDCTESGVWPGYSDDVEYLSLPPWVERQFLVEAW